MTEGSLMQPHHARSHPRRLAVALLMAVHCTVPVALTSAAGDAANPAIGARGDVGCRPDPTRVRRLSITKPGIYENILVDGEWADGTLVKIQSDGVTLRNLLRRKLGQGVRQIRRR